MIWGCLTPREREVFLAVAEGDSSKEIGRHLGISPRTVELHIDHLRTKLGVRKRSAIAATAARMMLAGEVRAG